MTVDAINKLLGSISHRENKTGSIYINVLKNEFIELSKEITIPKIPVSQLQYQDALPIVQAIVALVPLFLTDHSLLQKRQPPHELHSLHFATVYEGTCINFYHVLRLDFKFGGDSSAIIEPGNNDFYPSYKTNRLYYKSRLVPTLKTPSEPITPIKLIQSITTESDQFFHTYALFDDIDTSNITTEFINALPNIFTIPVHLYPFIVLDYYTACMNVPYPIAEEIKNALMIFEPLFFAIASRFVHVDSIVPFTELQNAFGDLLDIQGATIEPTDLCIQKSKEYFSRYSLSRDENCMVKGWWKLEIS